MHRVVLASCDNPPVEPEDDPLLAEALRLAGYDVSILPWTDIDPCRLPPRTAVILRSTWDYHRQSERFLQWIGALEETHTPVLNPPSLIRLTIDKSYLIQERPFGCATPVTARLPADADVIIREVRARNWKRFVLKPPVSASADGTFLLDANDHASLEAALAVQPGQTLMQEFIPEIREGELSLVFFGRWFSHAVRKIPAPEDFRVQSEFGSRTEPFRPAATVIATARSTLLKLPESPCYARVDGIMRRGEFLLMELELIEPELFLNHSPDAAELFARQIVARMRSEVRIRQ